MKIAIFTDFYLEDTPVSSAIKNLKKSYEEAGHKVYVMTASQTKVQEAEEGIFTFGSANIKQYPQFRLTLSPFLSAKKIVRGLKIDVIHNFAVASMGVAAATCKKDLKIPAVSTITELLPYTASYNMGSMEGFLRDMGTRYMKWLYGFFDVLTYPSMYARDRLKDITPKGDVINLPVETGNITNGSKSIGYIGSMERGREYTPLLNNMESLKNRTDKDVKLLITEGETPPKSEKVSYLDRWSNYGKLSAYIDLPNFSYYPFYALEFLQSGKPVIAPNNSPMAEFLKKINPEWIYENPSYLTDVVARALETKHENSQKIFEELNKLHLCYTEYLKVYESLT